MTPEPCGATPEDLVTVNALDCGVRRGLSTGSGMYVDHNQMLANVLLNSLPRHGASELSQIATDAEKPPRSPAKCA